MLRRLGAVLGIALGAGAGAAAGSGCTIAPRTFSAVHDNAPLVRARAVGLSQSLADQQAIPALISKLDDSDAVVRLAAIEELRRRTGKDFGYAPWADDSERAPSVAAWRSWWQARQRRVYPSSQQPAPAAHGETRRPRLLRR